MTVDQYIVKHPEWEEELGFLRLIIQKTKLEEHIKWGAPIYSYQNKNLVGLGAFKGYVGLWFFQGALLKDEDNYLINVQEGKTQAMRQWRFNSIHEMDSYSILEYLNETIKNQQQGKEIKPQKKPLIIPLELQEAFYANTALAESFEALSLTNKRDYAEHILEAKREETKLKRLAKIIPMIAQGVGLNDKYKK
jgi:uncharacterized protein YdeI (YjbR/CyaY-like superfamily)